MRATTLHEHDSGQRHSYWEAHGVDRDTVWISSRSTEYNAHMRQQRANKERICNIAQELEERHYPDWPALRRDAEDSANDYLDELWAIAIQK